MLGLSTGTGVAITTGNTAAIVGGAVMVAIPAFAKLIVSGKGRELIRKLMSLQRGSRDRFAIAAQINTVLRESQQRAKSK